MSLRLLWVSPLPPVRSGVSNYAVELLDELRRLCPVRVVAPPGWTPDSEWIEADGLELVPTETTPEAGELELLHLGNNPYHEWILGRLGPPAPVVVLHDLVLHHLLVESTLAHGDFGAYRERLAAACGAAGERLADARRHGMSGPSDPFLFPALAPFLASARGCVVHSEWGKRRVAEQAPGLPVARVPLVVADPTPVDRVAVRRRLGIEERDLVLMHLGFLTREKGLAEVLGGVAAARAAGAPVKLVLVGEGGLEGAVAEAVARVGLDGHVTGTGWVASDELRGLPAAADLGVVLRTPSAGETSAAALRFLACGTPVAVGGLRQFLEWPSEAAPRLTPGSATAAGLARLLLDAAAAIGSAHWERRRRAARAVYESEHRPADGARRLVEVLEAMA